jgi:hypothetical protein
MAHKFETPALDDLLAWQARENLGTGGVAKALGCTESQACRWLKGDSRPSPPWRSRIRKRLKIAEDRWLTHDERLEGAA